MISKDHGFTLIEILVVIAIFSIVALMLFQLFNSAVRVVTRVKQVLIELDKVELFEYKIRDEIRNCLDILYNDGRGITLWVLDKNKDKIPNYDELRAYYWDGDEQGVLYKIENGIKETVFENVNYVEWKVDTYDRATLVELKIKLRDKHYWILETNYKF
ncbi:MAG: type II secretion system protein [Candidatus Hydrogenedentota bacterium]